MPEAILPEPPGYMDIDNVYSGDELGRQYKGLIGEGVVGASHLVVSQRGAGATMGIDVAPGAAWVEGDASALLQPVYHQVITSIVQVSVAAADGSNPRIDRVVLRMDDATFDASGQRRARIEVITGTPAGSPAAPAEPASAITLATIAVGTGVTVIESANITDLRQPFTPDAGRAGSVEFAYRASAPWGTLVMDGSAFSGARYPRLAAAIGGTTLPDLRGRAPIGSGQGSGLTNRALGATVGTETHVLTEAQMPSHTHVQNSHNHTQSPHYHEIMLNTQGAPLGVAAGTGNAINYVGGNRVPSDNATATNNPATATNQSAGGGQAHPNMQPSLALLPLIRV